MDFPRKIYAIQHNKTKRMYIGSTKDVKSRFQHHISMLRANKHIVEDMQADFNEHGEDYSLFILEEITEHKDRGKEYEYMWKYNTIERGVGYNYKDNGRRLSFLNNMLPYVDGLPEKPENGYEKEKLHKLIDSLTDSQIIYVFAFVSKMFGEKE